MEDDIIPQPHDLRNKPLVEALFEIRWQIDSDANKGRFVSGILFGRYYDRVRHLYPKLEELPVAMIPEEMTPYTVRHRFRTGENQWPITQLGPGVLTINETDKYEWRTFRPRVEESLRALFESFPTEISPLKPTQVEIRYINMIPYDISNGNITGFLKEKLHIDIRLDEKLFDGPHDVAAENDLNFSISLSLKEPRGIGTLVFASGESDNRTGILWQLIIRTHPDFVPNSAEGIISWVNDAHGVVDDWFFKLARGELMKTFDG
jgi:uncharacterized protein (TIGR04255 family)